MSSMITVNNLSKSFRQYVKEPGLLGAVKSTFVRRYQDISAVRDVSFQIEKGEFVGFIGLNGAGKTTTLKCLSGLLYPTTGDVSVLGYKPWDRERDFLKQIALVMGNKNQLWWDLPAIDSYELNKVIYQIPEKQFRYKLNELIELLDLKDIINIPVRKLSLGQRMKCELVASLLHSPKVIFLDEPTLGLDVIIQKKLRTFFQDYNEIYGATIMLTSHYMDDVKELCKRVLVINNGALIYDGNLEALIKKYAKYKNISFLSGKKIAKSDLEQYGELLHFDGYNVVLSVPREELTGVMGKILNAFPVEDLEIKEIPLDDVVRTIFSRKG